LGRGGGGSGIKKGKDQVSSSPLFQVPNMTPGRVFTTPVLSEWTQELIQSKTEVRKGSGKFYNSEGRSRAQRSTQVQGLDYHFQETSAAQRRHELWRWVCVVRGAGALAQCGIFAPIFSLNVPSAKSGVPPPHQFLTPQYTSL
jgi:hypothetical protein